MLTYKTAVADAVRATCRAWELSDAWCVFAIGELESFGDLGIEGGEVRRTIEAIQMAHCAAGSFSADLIYNKRIAKLLGEHVFDVDAILDQYADATGEAAKFEGLLGAMTFAFDFFKDEVAGLLEHRAEIGEIKPDAAA